VEKKLIKVGILWAPRMVKMALRYFAKYDIIKIKIITSTKEPLESTGRIPKR
jgi:hypothetical protein